MKNSRWQPSFFFWLAVCYALLVLLGFGKSFFLRPLFANREVSPMVHVHGVALTLWYGLFVVQAALVAGRNLRLHRTLGYCSGVVVALTVVTSLYVAWAQPAYRLEGPPPRPDYDFEADVPHMAMVIVGNTGMLLIFSGFFGLGLRRRGDLEVHRRLMSLAGFCILGPAIGRLGTVYGEAGVTALSAPGVVAGLAIPVALLVHDWKTMGRLHRVNVVGLSVIFGWMVLGTVLSGIFGERVVRYLATVF